MALLSIKNQLKQAQDSRPQPKAKKHHFNRLLVAGMIGVGLSVAAFVGYQVWRYQKDKSEYVQKNPYSIDAFIARNPDLQKFYVSATPYSIGLDSLARQLLSALDKSEYLNQSYNYTFSFGLVVPLKFEDAQSLVAPYLEGGQKNQPNLSKSGMDSTVSLFSHIPVTGSSIPDYPWSCVGRLVFDEFKNNRGCFSVGAIHKRYYYHAVLTSDPSRSTLDSRPFKISLTGIGLGAIADPISPGQIKHVQAAMLNVWDTNAEPWAQIQVNPNESFTVVQASTDTKMVIHMHNVSCDPPRHFYKAEFTAESVDTVKNHPPR